MSEDQFSNRKNGFDEFVVDGEKNNIKVGNYL